MIYTASPGSIINTPLLRSRIEVMLITLKRSKIPPLSRHQERRRYSSVRLLSSTSNTARILHGAVQVYTADSDAIVERVELVGCR
jgi:hypothetical protein